MPDNKIGLIGTGIMGRPMGQNLLSAGYELVVYNRTKSKAEPLLDRGAQWADNPAEVARGVQTIIICVSDTPDVREVLLGKAGVINTARGGTVCIDMSTISPIETVELGKTLAQKDISMIDAPISGGELGAIEAKLSIMAGGDKAVFDKLGPIFEVLGRKITYCGTSGNGQRTKLANQIMVIQTMMSVAEGLSFAEKAGLDLETTLSATSAGAAGSRSLKVLGRKIVDRDMSPGFMVDLQLKDLRLVCEYADAINQPLPGVALARQLMTSLRAQGRGKDGIQALADVIRQLGASGNS